MTFGVEAIKIKVLNMFIEEKENHSHITIGQKEGQKYEDQLPDVWKGAYIMDYVPEGFYLGEIEAVEGFRMAVLVNDDGDVVLLVWLQDQIMLQLISSVGEVEITAMFKSYKDGRWQIVKSWNIRENGSSATLTKEYYVASGYEDRVV